MHLSSTGSDPEVRGAAVAGAPRDLQSSITNISQSSLPTLPVQAATHRSDALALGLTGSGWAAMALFAHYARIAGYGS